MKAMTTFTPVSGMALNVSYFTRYSPDERPIRPPSSSIVQESVEEV